MCKCYCFRADLSGIQFSIVESGVISSYICKQNTYLLLYVKYLNVVLMRVMRKLCVKCWTRLTLDGCVNKGKRSPFFRFVKMLAEEAAGVGAVVAALMNDLLAAVHRCCLVFINK